MSLHINKITLDLFTQTLSRYPSTAPSSLSSLDTLRYDTIPAKLATSIDPYLNAPELEKLVEWKLKHGTFRPSLLSLVKSNPASSVASTTRTAFADPDTRSALKTLTSLRGIGPATASLLLSVRYPESVPFFGDEVFRWALWEGGGEGGWKRKIKYNFSEYEELVRRVGGLRGRLGVSAVDVERVAWVLGREGVDVDAGEVEEEEEEEEESGEKKKASSKQPKKGKARPVKEDAKNVDTPTTKQGAKRKAKEETSPTEGTRRSTRRKT